MSKQNKNIPPDKNAQHRVKRKLTPYGTVSYVDEKTNQLHREDGPAIIHHNGNVEYYQQGKLHRENAPARLWAHGVEQYYLEGSEYKEVIYGKPMNTEGFE